MSDQGWIDVDERLPPDNQAVLVNHWMTGIEMAFRENGQWGVAWTNHMHSGSGYTHWRELPPPPETGETRPSEWPTEVTL